MIKKIKFFLDEHGLIKKTLKVFLEIAKIPFYIPAGIIMNIRKIIYVPRAEKSDSVGILCRGVSLSAACRLGFLKDFIIVNTKSQEMKAKPVRSLLKGKRIIHMINVGEKILPAWYLLRYNVYRYVISRLKPNGSNDTRLRWPRKVYATEKFGFRTEYLPEEMVPYLNDQCGTGVVAVIYAAVVMKKKNVYVVGMDFYQTAYMTGPLQPHETNLGEQADEMIGYVVDLIKKCPNTTFHFITASPSFNPSLPNVKITRLKC